jgi:hypothetical protein
MQFHGAVVKTDLDWKMVSVVEIQKLNLDVRTLYLYRATPSDCYASKWLTAVYSSLCDPEKSTRIAHNFLKGLISPFWHVMERGRAQLKRHTAVLGNTSCFFSLISSKAEIITTSLNLGLSKFMTFEARLSSLEII